MDYREINFSPPDIGEDEISEVVEALKSGWITTGPKTKKLEEELAQYCGASKTATFNSATAALEMTLRLLGVGPGDEVITSSYTYTASASVIDHVGAKIVMVDLDDNSFEMDYEKLESAITERTKVIIPVDIAGIMCDYDKIFEIIEKKKNIFKSSNEIQSIYNRIIILADGAHSLGAEYKGKKSGTVADFTAFSFHAVKNFTTAEGGAIAWKDIKGLDNAKVYQEYMLLSLHGQSKDAFSKMKLGAWEYDIVAPNFKCNLTDILASIGLAQLKRYPAMLDRRKEIIEKYDELLAEFNVKSGNHYIKDNKSSGHLYVLNLLDKDEKFRNALIEKMAKKGVATNVHYKPLPLLTAYKNLGFDINDYPNALKKYKNEITLPLHTLLSDEDVEYVIDVFKKSYRELEEEDK